MRSLLCYSRHFSVPLLDRAVFRPWRPMSSRILSGYARRSLCYYCCSADCWLLGLTLPIRRCQWACCTLRCVALHSRYTCYVALPPGGHVTLCMLLRVHRVTRVVELTSALGRWRSCFVRHCLSLRIRFASGVLPLLVGFP